MKMHIHVLQYTVYPVKQSVVVDVKITWSNVDTIQIILNVDILQKNGAMWIFRY